MDGDSCGHFFGYVELNWERGDHSSEPEAFEQLMLCLSAPKKMNGFSSYSPLYDLAHD